ncbi:MAG: methionyl-tRNA formyltransferase [Deltaproteobacteria bacterium]|jgi:methionyl-tRNA formyltransferase|nr:methionyl-tRNA formyltransferase [Deltaproteobacteria bacterium]
MGTPDFAVPALQALIQNGYHVPLVVTQPDRPKGRGRKLVAPPVKLKALELDLEVLQPSTLKDENFRSQSRQLRPDFFVVLAFGHILSENILQLPRLGTINIHASLLPKYRGPAPIQWAIMNGESETGITTMLMDKGVDTGDILLSQKEPIFPEDTAATLHERLAAGGADLLVKTLQGFASETIKPIPQDHQKATYAPLLKKQDGHIRWQKSADELDAFIRGMTPWPGAFTFHQKNRLRILKAAPIQEDTTEPAGTILETFPDELCVATGKGVLSISEIQGPSGKRLGAADFLRGYRLPPGTVLT